MDQLQQQIARARRRLVLEQFLARLTWCLLGAFTAAAVAVALPRIFVIQNLPEQWDASWLWGGLVAACLAAIAWTIVSRRSALDAAIEIDRRFELRERVASSLSLAGEEQQSEAGRAVINDALRAVSRIDVGDKFRVRFDRRAWWPLIPAAAMFALMAFVENRQAVSGPTPETIAQDKQQAKQTVESLRKKMEELRKQMEKEGVPPADGTFKQVEQATKELTDKHDLDKTKATVKLNDLAKKLEERRDQLGGKEGLQKQLQNMKNLGAGPGEKAAQAMKQGDFKKALEELAKLEKQIRDGKMDADAKQQLAKQIEQMKEKLEAAAEAHKQAAEDLKKQIEQQKKQGNLAKAGELQQKLDELQKQQAQMDKLQQMAQQMGQVQQGLQQGDTQKAADALAKMGEQLSQMQEASDKMEMLNAAMSQLEMAKSAMSCGKCSGEGCESCQGNMAMNGNSKNKSGKPGPGMGQGVGNGRRPEEKNATNLRDTQVRQKPGKGAAVFGGMVEGPNIKGDVVESIKEEMASLSAEPADPLTSERLPHSRQEQAEQYFQMLREGKQ